MKVVASLMLAVLTGGVIVFTSAGVGAAPVPKHLMKEIAEQNKLHGQWKVVSLRVQGAEIQMPGQPGQEMTYEFRQDNLTVGMGGKGEPFKIKLDEVNGVKRFAPADAAGPAGPGKTFAYAFDGENLLLSMPLGQAAQGQVIDPIKGENAAVFVLVRVKPAPVPAK